MFTITHHGAGYKISTGDGSPVLARDRDALHKALDHYYGGERHTDNIGCPFCAWMDERQKRGRR